MSKPKPRPNHAAKIRGRVCTKSQTLYYVDQLLAGHDELPSFKSAACSALTMMNGLFLLVLLSCCSWAAVLGAIQLLPYGTMAGDLQLIPDSATSSAELTLNTPIIFYGRGFNSAFVSFYLCQVSNNKSL